MYWFKSLESIAFLQPDYAVCLIHFPSRFRVKCLGSESRPRHSGGRCGPHPGAITSVYSHLPKRPHWGGKHSRARGKRSGFKVAREFSHHKGILQKKCACAVLCLIQDPKAIYNKFQPSSPAAALVVRIQTSPSASRQDTIHTLAAERHLFCAHNKEGRDQVRIWVEKKKSLWSKKNWQSSQFCNKIC